MSVRSFDLCLPSSHKRHFPNVIWGDSLVIFIAKFWGGAQLQPLNPNVNYLSSKSTEIESLTWLHSFTHWGRENWKFVILYPLPSLDFQIGHLLNSTHFTILKPKPLGTLPSQSNIHYHGKLTDQPQKEKKSACLVQSGQLFFHFVQMGNGKNQLCPLEGARNISVSSFLIVATSTLIQIWYSCQYPPSSPVFPRQLTE